MILPNLFISIELLGSLSWKHASLYTLPLPVNRMMKLFVIYNILCISFCNIFVEKEKYKDQQLCGAIAKFFSNIIFKLQEYYITEGCFHLLGYYLCLYT